MNKGTKYELSLSLKKILETKPLDKVTITDITEDCGVSRMTFYYHFQDIYALIEWMCIADAERVLAGKVNDASWQEGLYDVFQEMLASRSFVDNIYHSLSREHLEKYIYRLSERVFLKAVEEAAGDQAISEEDKLFIADFYKYAFVGIILNWIDNHMKEDPKLICDKLGLLIGKNIKEAVVRFTQQ